MYTLIKRSVASLSGPDLLNENPNFLFYKTLRGLRFPLMVKVFVIFSVNFSEIQQFTRPGVFWNWVYKYTYDGKIYKKLIIYTAPDCTSSAFVFNDCTGPLGSSFPGYTISYNFNTFADISNLIYICLDFLRLA